MAIPHFAAMLLFAALVSVVFAVITKDTTRARLLYGVKSFGMFIGIALALGWLMFLLAR